MGQGSRTGRGLGFCTDHDNPGYARGGGGRGRGFGFGFRKGMRRGMGWNASYMHAPATTISREDEIKLLKSQVESIKNSQESIVKRIQELQKEND